MIQLTIYHLLKLFQNDPAVIAGKKNVVSEQYDEIVFTDPTNTMYQLLTSPKPMVPAIRHEPGIDCVFTHTHLHLHTCTYTHMHAHTHTPRQGHGR